MKKILLISLLSFNLSIFSQETWRPLGPDDFNQASYHRVDFTSIAIDGNNIPYVVYCSKI